MRKMNQAQRRKAEKFRKLRSIKAEMRYLLDYLDMLCCCESGPTIDEIRELEVKRMAIHRSR